MTKKASLLSSTSRPSPQVAALWTDAKVEALQQKLQECHQALEAGRLGVASRMLPELRQQLPANGDVRQLEGILAHRRGKNEHAVERLKEAIDLDPNKVEYYSNLAVIYRAMDRPDDARDALNEAISRDPGSAVTHRNFGNILSDLGEFAEAAQQYRRSLELRPQHTETWLNYMFALARNGDLQQAVEQLAEAEATGIERMQAAQQVGQWLLQRARGGDAVAFFADALQFDEEDVTSLLGMASGLMQAERPNDAEFFLDKVLETEPDNVLAINHKATIAALRDRYEDARELLERCVELQPRAPKFYADLAGIMFRLDRIEDAERLCRTALEMNPELPGAHSILATIERTRGNFEASLRHAEKVIGKTSQEGGLFSSIYAVKKDVSEEDDVATILARLQSQETTSKKDLMAYNYTLGELFDQLKSPERAIFYFKAANELRRIDLRTQGHVYSREQDIKLIDLNIQIFTQEYFEARADQGNPSERPVFIVGMPRSGTTLTEQIISSHPAVHGAGELAKVPDLQREVTREFAEQNVQLGYPGWMTKLDAGRIGELAEAYLEHIGELAGDEPLRVTDKMPHNFMNLGLIAVMFPNARVIHCKRDPVDTCLSCFRQNFAMPHAYSTNLGTVGHHYRQYQRLMAHWREVLPIEFYEVQYEELVGDQERISRELIDFCGLEWDDACLRFNEQKRNVKTASVWQVRQPIYKKSVKKWKPYEPYIGELLEELGISEAEDA